MWPVRGSINGTVFIFGIVLKITSFIEHEMHTFNINLAHTTTTITITAARVDSLTIISIMAL